MDETIESVRTALKDLRPHTPEEYGLVAGLHSYKSVDTYRSRIMRKLGIGDLPGLVKFAIRHGLTPY